MAILCSLLPVLLLVASAAGARLGDSRRLEVEPPREPEIAELRARGTGDARPSLTVELVHGLGNQLFQVSALLSLALDHRPALAVELPAVVGRRGGRNRTYWSSVLRKLSPLLRPAAATARLGGRAGPVLPGSGSDDCVLEQVPHFDPFARDCSAAGVFREGWADRFEARAAACGSLTLRGLFQRPAFFGGHLAELRRLMWDEGTALAAGRHMVNLTSGLGSNNSAVVSLHYRLGDYGPNGWVLDGSYYDHAVEAVRRRLADRPLLCLVFSDEPERAWRRSEVLDGCGERVLVPPTVPDDVSLYMMSLAEASVIADSTFSYFSAVLAREGKRLVVAPHVLGPRGECWLYLVEGLRGARVATQAEWLSLPASTISESALLAEEVMQPAADEE